jgi:uncharacterized protein YeaO (DUF488 family)
MDRDHPPGVAGGADHSGHRFVAKAADVGSQLLLVPMLGHQLKADNARVRDVLRWGVTSAAAAAIASVPVLFVLLVAERVHRAGAGLLLPVRQNPSPPPHGAALHSGLRADTTPQQTPHRCHRRRIHCGQWYDPLAAFRWHGTPKEADGAPPGPTRAVGRNDRRRCQGHTVARRAMGQQVRLRRIYDDPLPDDGVRVLVDRVWPRGMAKAAAELDEWLKEVAPSTQLRRWYGHRPDRFGEFRQRYLAELDEPQRAAAVDRLRTLSRQGPVTLLTATRDVDHSQAAVLAELLRHAR